jgi:hypothetical protein
MWWNSQNLNSPRTDRSGRIWHFRVWRDHVSGVLVQRIFFWDDERTTTGLVELTADAALNVSRLKQLIDTIVASPEYRRTYQRPLEFPVERKYRFYEPL